MARRLRFMSHVSKIARFRAACRPRGRNAARAAAELFCPGDQPANGADIWVSSDMSQLFHSTDTGGSWQTQDFRTIQGGHETRMLFTENPLIRYTLDYTDPSGGAT